MNDRRLGHYAQRKDQKSASSFVWMALSIVVIIVILAVVAQLLGAV